jgi:hypothetical protein
LRIGNFSLPRFLGNPHPLTRKPLLCQSCCGQFRFERNELWDPLSLTDRQQRSRALLGAVLLDKAYPRSALCVPCKEGTSGEGPSEWEPREPAGSLFYFFVSILIFESLWVKSKSYSLQFLPQNPPVFSVALAHVSRGIMTHDWAVSYQPNGSSDTSGMGQIQDDRDTHERKDGSENGGSL